MAILAAATYAIVAYGSIPCAVKLGKSRESKRVSVIQIVYRRYGHPGRGDLRHRGVRFNSVRR